MSHCKQCGSYAINPGMHGRDGSDVDLCDVCYWRKRSDKLARLVKEHNDKMWNGCLSTRCNDNCETVGDCPMQYMIDLPEWAK